MLHRNRLDRIQIISAHLRQVAHAGLVLPVTLACHNSSRSTSTWEMPQDGPTRHCLKTNVSEFRSHKVSWRIQPRD